MEGQQTTDNRQQTTDNRQQTTDNRQQTTDNRQQTTDNRQQTTDNRQQTTDNRQQTTDNRQQTTDNRPRRKSSFLLNNLGFSIMGVLVAAGMMGGLALMLAQMTRQQIVNQKKAETGLEMNQLHHRILAVLYDGDACLKTMGKGGSLHNGRTLDKLLNKGGKPVLEKGVDINRTVRVERMVIQKVEGVGQTKEAEVWVTIKKLGEANKGMAEIVKKFPLTVELDTAGKIANCHHTLDSKEHGIKMRMCEEMGGEMIPVPGTPTTSCTLSPVYKIFCEKLGGVYTKPPEGTPVGDCNIKDTYVDQDGDTMSGDLHAPNLHASSTVTAGTTSPKPNPKPPSNDDVDPNCVPTPGSQCEEDLKNKISCPAGYTKHIKGLHLTKPYESRECRMSGNSWFWNCRTDNIDIHKCIEDDSGRCKQYERASQTSCPHPYVKCININRRNESFITPSSHPDICFSKGTQNCPAGFRALSFTCTKDGIRYTNWGWHRVIGGSKSACQEQRLVIETRCVDGKKCDKSYFESRGPIKDPCPYGVVDP